jgi:hypothetical protein
MPTSPTSTYSRSSTGSVHSDPFAACGNGLSANTPGSLSTTSKPDAVRTK